MLGRDNYSYKKYQKELAKKKKAEEKQQRKLEKKNLEAQGLPALSDRQALPDQMVSAPLCGECPATAEGSKLASNRDVTNQS